VETFRTQRRGVELIRGHAIRASTGLTDFSKGDGEDWYA
jgi:hypothetical protein